MVARPDRVSPWVPLLNSSSLPKPLFPTARRGYALSKAVVLDLGANMALCDVIPEGLRYVLERRLGDSD